MSGAPDLLIAVDTNVLVRFLYRDVETPSHTDRARLRIFTALEAGYRVYVPSVVLAETVWVLRRKMKVRKPQMVEILRNLVESSLFLMEDPEVAEDAFYRWVQDEADYADYLCLRLAYAVGAVAFLTFDTAIHDPLAVAP